MKKRTIVLLVILVLLAGITAAGIVVKNKLEKNLKGLADLPIAAVDLSTVPDGTYDGGFSAFPVTAEVRVAIVGGTITSIELVKHVTGKGQAAEVLPSRVVAGQTLQLDAVAGATYSSKVILKAIEQALASAGR